MKIDGINNVTGGYQGQGSSASITPTNNDRKERMTRTIPNITVLNQLLLHTFFSIVFTMYSFLYWLVLANQSVKLNAR